MDGIYVTRFFNQSTPPGKTFAKYKKKGGAHQPMILRMRQQLGMIETCSSYSIAGQTSCLVQMEYIVYYIN
jgi:hypothetical protein